MNNEGSYTTHKYNYYNLMTIQYSHTHTHQGIKFSWRAKNTVYSPPHQLGKYYYYYYYYCCYYYHYYCNYYCCYHYYYSHYHHHYYYYYYYYHYHHHYHHYQHYYHYNYYYYHQDGNQLMVLKIKDLWF